MFSISGDGKLSLQEVIQVCNFLNSRWIQDICLFPCKNETYFTEWALEAIFSRVTKWKHNVRCSRVKYNLILHVKQNFNILSVYSMLYQFFLNILTNFCRVTTCPYLHDVIKSWRHYDYVEHNSIFFILFRK